MEILSVRIIVRLELVWSADAISDVMSETLAIQVLSVRQRVEDGCVAIRKRSDPLCREGSCKWRLACAFSVSLCRRLYLKNLTSDLCKGGGCEDRIGQGDLVRPVRLRARCRVR